MKTRREWFMSLAGRKPALRPPWTAADYAAQCTGCGDCIPACPESVLVAGPRGVPQISPGGDGCTQCGECVTACPEQVFDIRRPAFTSRARVSERCLALMGVHCRSCEEACPELAIRFRPALGGVPQPELDGDACTGCTACLPACPQQAIEMREMVGVPA